MVKRPPTYGNELKARVKRLFEALLNYAERDFEDEDNLDIQVRYKANNQLIFTTKLRSLETLTANDRYEGKISKEQIWEALTMYLKDFLEILEDNRTKTQGADIWEFTLKLWHEAKDDNLKQFEIEWYNRRFLKSKPDTNRSPSDRSL